MAEHAFEKIKTGGLFSSRIKVIYETKLVRMLPGGGEVNATVLYTEDASKRLGYCEYMFGGREGKINSFTIDDWSIEGFAQGLLRQVVTLLKKKGIKTVDVEIYDKDNTTQNKLATFKKLKFKMATGGSFGGYNRYLFKKNL